MGDQWTFLLLLKPTQGHCVLCASLSKQLITWSSSIISSAVTIEPFLPFQFVFSASLGGRLLCSHQQACVIKRRSHSCTHWHCACGEDVPLCLIWACVKLVSNTRRWSMISCRHMTASHFSESAQDEWSIIDGFLLRHYIPAECNDCKAMNRLRSGATCWT